MNDITSLILIYLFIGLCFGTAEAIGHLPTLGELYADCRSAAIVATVLWIIIIMMVWPLLLLKRS